MNPKNENLVCLEQSQRPDVEPASGKLEIGKIYYANEDRFTAANYSEEVTDYVVGHSEQEQIAVDLESIAPMVEVGRRFEYKKAEDASFLSEADDIRGAGADFKRVEDSGTTVNGKTHNKGFTQRIDKDDLPVGVGGGINRKAAKLLDRILRNDLRRAVGLYNSANNTNKTWDATANPDMDLLDMIERSADSAGIYPNVLVLSPAVWIKRFSSLTDPARTQIPVSAQWTMQQLADFLGIQRIVQIRERYQAAKGAAKSKVWGSTIACGNLESIVDQDDASCVKRFVTLTEVGTPHRVHIDDSHAKYLDLTVEQYSLLAAPTELGLEKLTIA